MLSITLELVKMQNVGSLPDLLNRNLQFFKARSPGSLYAHYSFSVKCSQTHGCGLLEEEKAVFLSADLIAKLSA